MVGLLVRSMNCTPTEALDELRSNPWIADVVEEQQYRIAYLEWQEWQRMSAEQRKDLPQPSGWYHEQVLRNEIALAREAPPRAE